MIPALRALWWLIPAGLSCLLLLYGKRAGAAVEVVRYEVPGGPTLLADFYRPAEASSKAVVLLPGAGEQRASFGPLADRLQARNWLVLVPDGVGPAPADLPLLVRAIRASEEYLRRAGGDSLRTLILGGSGLGAAEMLAVAATPGASAAQALLLLSPELEVAGLRVDSLSTPPRLPLLLLDARDDLSAGLVRRLYLGLPGSVLWEIDGAGAGTALLARQRSLAPELAEWCDRWAAPSTPLKNSSSQADYRK